MSWNDLTAVHTSGKFKDLTGKRFGKFVVKSLLGKDGSGKITYLCVCDCGVEFTRVQQGVKKSKACFQCSSKLRGHSRQKYKHLKNWKPAYESWRGMKSRCLSEKDNHYKYYGALGIKVCEEWLDSENGFMNFYNDLGERPAGKTLDRIDVHGDYCKDNCRWADLTTQAYNTNRGHLNKSGKIGVRLVRRKSGAKYVATISYNNKSYYLGIFDYFEEACKAREEAEIKYYGVTK